MSLHLQRMPRLSIVIAAYDMQREIPRTLCSFLPPLQRSVEDIDYEIVVVDNGSPSALSLSNLPLPPPRPIRLVRVNPSEASPSPVACINAAVRDHTIGDWLMICVDGARMASSYLVRRSVDILTRHADAFTFVASRHLGPKTQMQSVNEGYDQDAEDRLLDSVDWQMDLDLLYDISVWAGAHARNNLLLQNESNAIAMSRSAWERWGGYNERFRRPGGGLCNLELFSRHATRENALNVLLYGETTFHQFHGGAATAHAGYFHASQEEHWNATGNQYERPSFAFLADLGERYKRMQAVGRYLVGARASD